MAAMGSPSGRSIVSLFLVLAVGWLALAVLGWSWFATAARADRARIQRPPKAPPRSQPRPRI
jgi:hypothetical protein